MTLDRLEKKGLLRSTLSDPTPERGGRAKRCYALTRSAVQALRASRQTLLSLWQGLEPLLEK
jgi:DNA-binding PadR family transcriptional regulator